MANDPERFTWRGINFVWKREAWPHFAVTQAVTGTYATVAPEGLAWSAAIRVGGGECPKQIATTPNEALDAALEWWERQVGALRGNRERDDTELRVSDARRSAEAEAYDQRRLAALSLATPGGRIEP